MSHCTVMDACSTSAECSSNRVNKYFGHWCKVSCMRLNLSFYLNSHRWFLCCLVYISCLVLFVVSRDMKGLVLAHRPNRAVTLTDRVSLQKIISNKNYDDR
jgi:hypothetical protein